MIVITTPTGTIGRQILKDVLDSGEPIRVIARDPSRIPSQVRDRVEVVEGSHGDLNVVTNAFYGADTVFWLVPPDPRAQFPRLNVLINNAGISRMEDFTADAFDSSVAQSIIQTNIISVLHLTAALLPLLQQQPSPAIITTTSGLAFVPFASFPTYCATKAFLHSWMQSLRFQLRNTSMEVLELIPPYVQTELRATTYLTECKNFDTVSTWKRRTHLSKPFSTSVIQKIAVSS